MKLKFLVYGLFLGITCQNLALAIDESSYCDTSWWETATPGDLSNTPIENVNEIECQEFHVYREHHSCRP